MFEEKFWLEWWWKSFLFSDMNIQHNSAGYRTLIIRVVIILYRKRKGKGEKIPQSPLLKDFSFLSLSRSEIMVYIRM